MRTTLPKIVSAYNLSFDDVPAVSAVATVEAMTPPVIARWIDIIENGRTSELESLLAEDAVFYSPAVFTPGEGRDATLAYLSAAAKVFDGTDFHYVDKWYGERSAILEFAATID